VRRRGSQEAAVFEVVEYVEEEASGRPTGLVRERSVGTFPTEAEAVLAARKVRKARLGTEYAWWVVRRQGERLASWIADSRSAREFVVDLSSSKVVDLV
jgi:hypothetical protein